MFLTFVFSKIKQKKVWFQPGFNLVNDKTICFTILIIYLPMINLNQKR